MAYKARLAKHCGIITVRNPKTTFSTGPLPTNRSEKSKIPRTDLIEKAKEFLETTEEPKWYRYRQGVKNGIYIYAFRQYSVETLERW
jgi:hypothetical protein